MLHNSELAVWRERASEQKENNNNKNSNTTAAQPPSTLHRSLTRFFPVSILYTIRNANEPSLTLYCGTFHAHFRIRKIYWYRLSYVADSPRVCVWRFEWVCERSLLVPRSFTLSHISALFHLANSCHNLSFRLWPILIPSHFTLWSRSILPNLKRFRFSRRRKSLRCRTLAIYAIRDWKRNWNERYKYSAENFGNKFEQLSNKIAFAHLM